MGDDTAKLTRSLSEERVRAVVAVLLLAIVTLLPPWTPVLVGWVPGAFGLALSLWCWRRASPAGGMVVLVTGIALLPKVGVPWPLALPIALLVLKATSLHMPGLVGPKWERGRWLALGTIGCALVTPAALATWVVVMQPNLSDLTWIMREYPWWMLLIGALLFAVTNALGEEWVFRGVFQPRLAQCFGVEVAIVVQAVSFGVAHTWGVPRGAAGVLLAGTWALLLGVLRHHAGGLLAVVLAHVVADITVAGVVYWSSLS